MKGIHDQIRQAALRLTARICAHTQAAAHRFGLGTTDSCFLALLALHGPLTPGQLATATGLSTGAVTGAIDRLEHAGFVRRRRDTTDRRKRYVTLRPAARVRLAAEYRHWINPLDATLGRHTPTELRIIADFLADLTTNHRPPPRPPRPSTASGHWGQTRTTPG